MALGYEGLCRGCRDFMEIVGTVQIVGTVV